jgi:hypothetical protein
MESAGCLVVFVGQAVPDNDLFSCATGFASVEVSSGHAIAVHTGGASGTQWKIQLHYGLNLFHILHTSTH